MPFMIEINHRAPGPECKPGCLGDRDGFAHRSPIECTTLDDLYQSLSAKDSMIAELRDKSRRLKAALYDYEHQDD